MSRSALPPGPELTPATQARLFTHEPLEYLERCQAEFGDVFTIRLAMIWSPIVVTADPADVERVFRDSEEVYLGGAGNREMHVDRAMGESFLMALDGSAHAHMQSALRRMFVDAHGWFAGAIREAARHRMRQWDRTISVREESRQLAIEIAMDFLLGQVRDAGRNELIDAIRGMLDTTVLDDVPNILGSTLMFFPRRTRVYELFDAAIASERGSRHGANGLSQILALEHPDTGERLSQDELREQLLSLSVAGHDSTASILAFVLDYIGREPETAAFVRDDCERIADAREVTPTLLGTTRHLDAVLNETMRLRVVTPFVNRRLTATQEVGGWKLPEGTVVCPSLHLVHRGPHYDNAETFQRERFLHHKPTPYQFFPFGGGARRCIGEFFGRMELKLVLAEILTRFEFEITDDVPLTRRRGFVIAPSNPIRARVRRVGPAP